MILHLGCVLEEEGIIACNSPVAFPMEYIPDNSAGMLLILMYSTDRDKR